MNALRARVWLWENAAVPPHLLPTSGRPGPPWAACWIPPPSAVWPQPRGPMGKGAEAPTAHEDTACLNPHGCCRCRDPTPAQVLSLGEMWKAEGQASEEGQPGGEGQGQAPCTPGRRPPASPHRADEVVPVLAPHVRAACDVDAELLMGPQHALGDVGEEGSSFPVRQHALHKIWGENQESGFRTPGWGGEVQTLRR